jgi:hypothetical protein
MTIVAAHEGGGRDLRGNHIEYAAMQDGKPGEDQEAKKRQAAEGSTEDSSSSIRAIHPRSNRSKSGAGDRYAAP